MGSIVGFKNNIILGRYEDLYLDNRWDILIE